MKLKLLWMILLLASLLFSGCDKAIPSRVFEHRVGDVGLVMSLPNFPEQTLYTGEPEVSFQVLLENKGAYPVDKTIAYFKVPPPLGIGQDGSLEHTIIRDKPLRGRKKFESVASFARYSTLIHIPTADQLAATDVEKYPLQSFYCYNYKSQADLAACVGPRTGPGSCDFDSLNKELNLTKGQGAPVAITEVRQRLTQGKEKVTVSFLITVENRQKGYVLAPDVSLEDACTRPGVHPFQFALTKALFRGQQMHCTGPAVLGDKAKQMHFTLLDKPTVLLCTVDEEFSPTKTMVTELSLELSYVYRDFVSDKQVSVKRRFIPTQ